MGVNNSFVLVFSLVAYIILVVSVESFVVTTCKRQIRSHLLKITINPEIVDDDIDNDEDDEAWIPDRNKKTRRRPMDNKSESSQKYVNANDGDHPEPKTRQTYTPEEEDMIRSLGGRSMNRKGSKREPGFLGDCTIKEIAHDFQVPIPYLADVLCGWGVPPPIDCDAPIGDMVTGEHCFAILEAIHTLDIGVLHDKYSNFDMMSLCDEFGIDLKDAFQLAIKENWNLPFGVQTHLRVEQEEQLLQELAGDDYSP
jgi:hypothetical protein